MIEGGADVRFIQAMLGHANINTTQIYTQVSIRKLKEDHEATHAAKDRRPDEPKQPPNDSSQNGSTGGVSQDQ